MFESSCGSHTSESKIEKTDQPANTMYQCPMKCEGEKMYDKPGQCPECNIDLRKTDATHEHEGHDHNH